jgi:hypothetical protein
MTFCAGTRPASNFDALAESYDRREELRGDPLELWLRRALPAVSSIWSSRRRRCTISPTLTLPLRTSDRWSRRREEPSSPTLWRDSHRYHGGCFALARSSTCPTISCVGAKRHLRSIAWTPTRPGSLTSQVTATSRAPSSSVDAAPISREPRSTALGTSTSARGSTGEHRAAVAEFLASSKTTIGFPRWYAIAQEVDG